MRILIGTSEICGWITLLQSEFRKQGHTCCTLVKGKNSFYSSSNYTYDASHYHINAAIFGRVGAKLNRISSRLYLDNFVRRSAHNYDLIVYLWDTILPSGEDVKMFKDQGAKVVFFFVGSDVRAYRQFSSKYDVSQWQFPEYWVSEDVEGKKRYVELAEKYADCIYSVPDQDGLQTRPYYHLQIPVDVSRFAFKNNRREVPNVLHLPSEPWKKGTDIIEKVIKDLKSDGVKINFHSYRNLVNEKIPGLLQDMDVLVDEIVFHGPGALAFEAMASGCAVATRFLESSPTSFRPPVWNINAKNIYDKLRRLLTDFSLQQGLIEDGRLYVVQHNDVAVVAKNLLLDLEVGREPDYYPVKRLIDERA